MTKTYGRELQNYFASLRSAFEDRSIQRGIIVAEGNTIACQTWIEGTFAREFTQSPAGPLPPIGRRVVWDLSDIYAFDDRGRITAEWIMRGGGEGRHGEVLA
jgi:predicted ester cyclase